MPNRAGMAPALLTKPSFIQVLPFSGVDLNPAAFLFDGCLLCQWSSGDSVGPSSCPVLQNTFYSKCSQCPDSDLCWSGFVWKGVTDLRIWAVKAEVETSLPWHHGQFLNTELCQRVLFLLGKPGRASCLGRTLRKGLNGLQQ